MSFNPNLVVGLLYADGFDADKINSGAFVLIFFEQRGVDASENRIGKYLNALSNSILVDDGYSGFNAFCFYY